MRKIVILLLLFSGKVDAQVRIGDQLLVVTAVSTETNKGTLSLYEREAGEWVKQGDDIQIVLGRNGLAWDKKNFSGYAGYSKHEGDGKSPAGIFPLREVFSYGDVRTKARAIRSDSLTFCVDDPASMFYNKIVRTDTLNKEWNSAEKMKLRSDAYKYGIVVGYNDSPVEQGAGSCIFLHLWDGPEGKTAGCTAMTEKDLLRIIAWIDPKLFPTLVQVPQKAYKKLRKQYHLP